MSGIRRLIQQQDKKGKTQVTNKQIKAKAC